jgi:ferredoxin
MTWRLASSTRKSSTRRGSANCWRMNVTASPFSPATSGGANPDVLRTAKTQVSTTRNFRKAPGARLGFSALPGYRGSTMSSEQTVFDVHMLMPREERSIRVGRQEHISDAALAAGHTLPALCHRGRCLVCAGWLDNGGKVDQSDSVSYFPEDRRAGFVLLCTGNLGPVGGFELIRRMKCANLGGSKSCLRHILRPWVGSRRG